MINTLAPEAVLSHWISAFNTRNFSEFRQLCSANITVHSVSPNDDEARGLNRLAAVLKTYGVAFPDGHFEVKTVDIEGDSVTATWTATGTNTGSFLYFSATNRRVVVNGTCRFRFEQGLVTEHWLDFSLYSILEQIGALFSNPGESLPSSLAVCDSAMQVWSDALANRRIFFDSVFSADVVVYATAFRMRTIEQGIAALAKALAVLHANLADIQFSMARRISQGLTTTYRGNLTGVVFGNIESEEFNFDCMFRTGEGKVDKFWFRIWREL